MVYRKAPWGEFYRPAAESSWMASRMRLTRASSRWGFSGTWRIPAAKAFSSPRGRRRYERSERRNRRFQAGIAAIRGRRNRRRRHRLLVRGSPKPSRMIVGVVVLTHRTIKSFERRRFDLPQSLIAPARLARRTLSLICFSFSAGSRPTGGITQAFGGAVDLQTVMVMVALAFGQCAFHSLIA